MTNYVSLLCYIGQFKFASFLAKFSFRTIFSGWSISLAIHIYRTWIGIRKEYLTDGKKKLFCLLFGISLGFVWENLKTLPLNEIELAVDNVSFSYSLYFIELGRNRDYDYELRVTTFFGTVITITTFQLRKFEITKKGYDFFRKNRTFVGT
jgi:hypothetical protein